MRGCPRQRLRQQNPSRPPGPRSCQMARCPRTPPRPFRRPLCPSWRAGFAPIPTKSGASKASGWILGSWERRRPGPASAASRSLQKIVGAIVGAASRAGREHLQGSSPPDSTTSRIRGDLDVRVPRRSARARASVRRWPWSSRRGRSVQVKLIKMGGRLVRHARRLIFQLSEVSVPRRLFQVVLDRIGRLSPAPS